MISDFHSLELDRFPHDYTGVSRLGFRDASDIVVAVVDCGMDLTMKFLKDNLWNGRSDGVFGSETSDCGNVKSGQVHGIDFTEPDSPFVNPVPSPGEPTHGTNVASIIGARPGVEPGHEGVAHSVQMMSLKVFPTEIRHYAASVSRAIMYAVDEGAQIINCSFFLYSNSPQMVDAFQYACEKGVLVVAAAGNEDADLSGRNGFPATLDFPNILTVGAIDCQLPDHLSDKSNYGKKVHLAAPGGKPPRSGDEQRGRASTSFATAYVSGACALVWQFLASGGHTRKDLAYDVKQALLDNAKCVYPAFATGIDTRHVKWWGKGNPVLDLGFLA